MTRPDAPPPPRAESIERSAYHRWLAAYDRLDERDLRALANLLSQPGRWPRISVVMPVFNTPRLFLAEAIESVRSQIYPHWELCIADDASTDEHVWAILTAAAQSDSRIKVTRLEQNGHISAATNRALELATGEFVALVDHDDRLAPQALALVALEARRCPHAELIYTDSDNLTANGERCNPYFKPDWNYDLLLAQNYLNHLTVYRRSRLVDLGGLRLGLEGSQDYDLLLRYIEGCDPASIRHLPHVLYHWRIVPTSFSRLRLADANQRARNAIQEHLQRCGQAGGVVPAQAAPAFHRVQRPLLTPPPSVTVFATANDARLATLRDRTSYPTYDLQTVDDAAPAQVWNALACQSRSEVLVFVAAGLLPVEPDWLSELVAQAMRPDVGLVAAKILRVDGTTLPPGLLPGRCSPPTLTGTDDRGGVARPKGYFARFCLDHGVTAVSGGCYAVRTAVFRRLGGFDPQFTAPELRELDLSLRVGRLPAIVLWTAHAQLRQCVPPDEDRGGDSRDLTYLHAKWGSQLADELCDNPNLQALETGPCLAFPPRIQYPWREPLRRTAA